MFYHLPTEEQMRQYRALQAQRAVRCRTCPTAIMLGLGLVGWSVLPWVLIFRLVY